MSTWACSTGCTCRYNADTTSLLGGGSFCVSSARSRSRFSAPLHACQSPPTNRRRNSCNQTTRRSKTINSTIITFSKLVQFRLHLFCETWTLGAACWSRAGGPSTGQTWTAPLSAGDECRQRAAELNPQLRY